MTKSKNAEEAPQAESDQAPEAGADMLSEGAPSFDEQEQAPEAEAEFSAMEAEFPADESDEDSESDDVGADDAEDAEEAEPAPVFNENTPAGLGQKAAYEASLAAPAEPALIHGLPLDEQHPAIQADVAARDRALQAKVDEKARKQEIKDAKEAAKA